MFKSNIELNMIIYHANCLDGATSAFCAWLALGDACVYIPGSYDSTDNIFAVAEDKNILMLDFSLKKKDFLRLTSIATNVSVLDHHLTAHSELHGLENVHIDLEKCGSSLAWNFFNHSADPLFIQYVEDCDLWRWQQQDSYYFYLGLKSLLESCAYDFKKINPYFNDLGVETIIDTGIEIYNLNQPNILDGCSEIKINTLVYNNVEYKFGYLKVEHKKILNELSIYALNHLNLDAIMIYYHCQSTQHKFSLRRKRDSNALPLHKLAELFSGGGHAFAASFYSNLSPEEIFKLWLNQ